jgi:NAD-dependent dihydropyrimidine dehydrogenase PreA subunit
VDCIDLYEARLVVNKTCIDCMLCVWICPVETLAPLHEIEEASCATTTTA